LFPEGNDERYGTAARLQLLNIVDFQHCWEIRDSKSKMRSIRFTIDLEKINVLNQKILFIMGNFGKHTKLENTRPIGNNYLTEMFLIMNTLWV
jgi:hypothetical protein